MVYPIKRSRSAAAPKSTPKRPKSTFEHFPAFLEVFLTMFWGENAAFFASYGSVLDGYAAVLAFYGSVLGGAPLF